MPASVVRYTIQIVRSVFQQERPWIGAGSPYSGTDLKNLLWRYVHDKIRRASDGQQPGSAVVSDWLKGLPELMQDLMDAETRADNPAQELVPCIEYTVFGGKHILMREFQDEAKELEKAVYRLTTGGGS